MNGVVATEARRARILLVDDERRNCALLASMLEPRGYLTDAAVSGSAALEVMERDPPDLVLLDVMMPGLSGYEVVARIKGSERLKSIPVIMITALDDRDARLQALAAGAEEFLSKPVDRAELWARVRNLLRLKEYSDFLSRHNTLLNEQVEARTAALRASHRDTIATMTRAAAYKDEETGAHIERISHYCVRLGETLGMPAEFLDNIAFASPMHDVGKIAIADDILFKETPFAPEEWRVMQSHAELGARLLAGSDSPYLRMGAEIALNHHERWDGTGYPAGRAGPAIPLAARIMSVCDVYDALRSRRPYKPPYAHERAVEIIREGDGRTAPAHFDPEVLAAFLHCTDDFAEIYSRLQTRVR